MLRSGAAFVVVAALVAGSALLWQAESPTPSEVLRSAESAVDSGDFQTAESLSEELLRQDPSNAGARLVVAKCLLARRSPRKAIAHLSEIARGQSPQAIEAAWRAGDTLFFALHEPSEALRHYRLALGSDPLSVEANNRLAVLLAITGQWWKHIPARIATLKGGSFNAMDLLVLALRENALLNPELAEPLSLVSPRDPLSLLTNARLAIEDEQHDSAIQMLTAAIRANPDLVQAQVLLGEEYFLVSDEMRFADWLRSLPASADSHPTTWMLRGNRALERGQQKVALRCFCEAVQRDPNFPDALYQAGQILESLNRSEEATSFFHRSAQLQQYTNAVKAVDRPDAIAESRRAAELAESLGNLWEAWGWASIVSSHQNRPEWAMQMKSRLKPQLSSLPLRRTAPQYNPTRTFDCDDLPSWKMLDLTPNTETDQPQDSTDHFSFQDQAELAGVEFQYFNGSQDPGNGIRHMYEVMGGGVAVVDFNSDGHPDLYLTQGNHWPAPLPNQTRLDRLYLNAGNGGFIDVTDHCGIVEEGFSQGAAVGDFDSDGFPDILVANIGRNRLFRNNGDGTFSDVSLLAGLERSDWSTSCAIADVSGDSHPELYFVNYLEAEDLFTRTCGPQFDEGCLPQQFSAATDQLLWNLGNGQFDDVTKVSGVDAANGKGLGVVVGSFGNSNGIDIFVGNDTVSNFRFENQGGDSNAAPRFLETAMVSGLAVNGSGTAEACMGIAAGDSDGDGAIDLFVTNFHGETNTLYRQTSEGIFTDTTLRSGLWQPGLSKLGFGTQFADADLDGRLDLVVANGHIENTGERRTEYQMQPQFFANEGHAGFREVSARTLGPYFRRRMLGRALARIDWDSDGRPDFAVTHLDAPTALLRNTTHPYGNFVVLELHGTRSSRDAVGCVVQLETAHQTLTRQLVAGHGFQAASQSVLTFGLGEETTVQMLTIRWPSGYRGTYSGFPVNGRVVIVEGRQSPYAVPVGI